MKRLEDGSLCKRSADAMSRVPFETASASLFTFRGMIEMLHEWILADGR